MIDLHSHILPGIDDGAEDLCEAGKMLAMQYMSGVDRLFLTPHFYPAENSIDTFLSARERAWELLSDSPASQKPMQIRLGAEVRYGEQLLSLDLRKLTLGGSCYLLLELPRRGNPAYLQDFIGELLGEGLIPILAHIEQCAYFRQDPELLAELVDMGTLAQVSVQALFDKRDLHFSVACLQHGLAQIVASDAHNTRNRKPCMELVSKLPHELRQLHDTITAAVWDNDWPPIIRTTPIKKKLFGYR